MADEWIGPLFRNTIGLIATVFVVRLLDSLTTVVGNGTRLSTWVANMVGGGQ